MWRLLADEDFNARIVRGLQRVQPDLDIETVPGVGLSGASDLEVLIWAAAHNRVLLSHDRRTIPTHAYDRVRDGAPMAGVILVNKRAPVGVALQELLLVLLCSGQHELNARILHVPF